jgi:hypothetical protein
MTVGDREDWFVQRFIDVWNAVLLTLGDNESAVALIRKMLAAQKTT